MIIRSLNIQSHDNSGADVFKLMIISVCCIQTQLIVFTPNAARRESPNFCNLLPYFIFLLRRLLYDVPYTLTVQYDIY